jgi:hypothetical protein
MPNDFRPLARTQGLIFESLDDELLIYDVEDNLLCRLNRTAALVWQNADGSRTVDELADTLRAELGDLADVDLVLVSLDRLHEHGLIAWGYEPRDSDAAGLSRRRFIRRTGVVGTAALALPLVTSLVAPVAADAQSGK